MTLKKRGVPDIDSDGEAGAPDAPCADPEAPSAGGAASAKGPQLFTYDLTIWQNVVPTAEELHELLRGWAKHYVFQLEQSDARADAPGALDPCGRGMPHWQCRISLIKKRRVSDLKKNLGPLIPGCYIAPTVKGVHDGNNFNYTMKADTRVAGPYTDKDYSAPLPLTRVVKAMLQRTLYPWQQSLKEIAQSWDERTVHLVYDPVGGIGKSSLIELFEFQRIVYEIPCMNSCEDLMQAVMGIGYKPCFVFDFPRSLPKKHLQSMYAGIECIKNGVAYDKRYSFKKIRFERPTIIVFTNVLPDPSWLSQDRWRIYNIKGNYLVRVTTPQ